MSWKNAGCAQYYNRALEYDDIIKLVGSAKSMDDNFPLAKFRNDMSHDTPLIAINMGQKGKLSGILNGFMTPVSHPALQFKAAPGQLPAAEIRSDLSLLGEIEPQNYFIFGKPISASRSPAPHHSLFKEIGLPNVYERFETDNADEIKSVSADKSFDGAGVTIPLKLDVISHIDELSDAAKLIGGVNTIIKVRGSDGTARLVGDNTDWTEFRKSLTAAGAQPGSSLIIGSGGTARAAIYALESLSYSPV